MLNNGDKTISPTHERYLLKDTKPRYSCAHPERNSVCLFFFSDPENLCERCFKQNHLTWSIKTKHLKENGGGGDSAFFRIFHRESFAKCKSMCASGYRKIKIIKRPEGFFTLKKWLTVT